MINLTVKDFNDLTQPLIGQPLSQLHYSYGDVFVLNFGELIPYSHSKLSHLKTSKWKLLSYLSTFVFDCENSTFINQTLNSIKITKNLDLKLTFNNDKEINVLSATSASSEILPYWELWMSGDSFIVASNKGLELRLKNEIIK